MDIVIFCTFFLALYPPYIALYEFDISLNPSHVTFYQSYDALYEDILD